VHCLFSVVTLNAAYKRFKNLYSYLNATMGSTLAARRAGTKQANVLTQIKISDAKKNETKSVGLTPYKRLAMSRVSPNAAGTPTPSPIRTTGIIAIAKEMDDADLALNLFRSGMEQADRLRVSWKTYSEKWA